MQGIFIKFDFSWYPFDTQKIILPILTGKWSEKKSMEQNLKDIKYSAISI